MAETLGALLLQRPGQKPQWHTADAGGPMLGAADLPGEAAAGGSAGAGGGVCGGRGGGGVWPKAVIQSKPCSTRSQQSLQTRKTIRREELPGNEESQLCHSRKATSQEGMWLN